MINLLWAVVLFALTAYCGSLVLDGFRYGKMPLLFGHIFSLTFDRRSDPMFFWGAVAFDAVVIAILGGGGIILLVGAVLAA
jgi:hypothetical protein